MLGQILVPVLCCTTFLAGAFVSIHLSKPTPQVEEHAIVNDTWEEYETVRQSYPIYMGERQIGHCVLGIRTERIEPEPGFADPERVEEFGKIYKQASVLLRDVDEAETSCTELAIAVSDFVEIKESGFLPN